MASISAPYTVTTLPRISLPKDVTDCVISEVSERDDNYIDLGVSGSIIGTYILRPTPKLYWSYAISPTTVVTALANFGSFDTQRRFAVGVKDYKKNKLLLIEKNESNGTEDASIEQPLVKSTNLLLPAQLVGLKFGNSGKSLFCLLENGDLQVYEYHIDENEPLEPLYKVEGNKKSKVVYHKFLDKILGSELTNVESYLITVESSSSKFLIARTFALLTTNELLEVNQTTIDFQSKNFTMDFNSNGSLVIYDIDSQLISIFTLPNTTLQKQISVTNRVKDLYNKSNNQISLISAAPNRVLLAINGTVLLIEITFEAILATYTADSNSTYRILSCETVKGSSLKTQQTLFLALELNSKEALTSVQYFGLNVGLGTLNDCLGKGINRIQKKTLKDEEFFQTEVTGLSSLINESSIDDEGFFLENSLALRNELFEVYRDLRNAKEQKDIEKWESIFLPYVKGFSLKDILSVNFPELKEGQQDFQVFELEKDRVIDSRFFYKVASLIFTKDEEKRITLLDKSFVPEKTLTYLLTHPLFPMEFSNGLLQSLHKFPRLVRQAIVTCPNLSCFELIQQLNVIENEEIFKDLVIRLSEEYSSEKITSETTKIINTNNKKRRNSLDSLFDLDKIISKIINLNFGFEILNSFIDSNGLILSLHYSKSEHNLDNLIAKIDKKTDSLLVNSQLLTLVEQSLINSTEFNDKKSNKKKKSKSKMQAAELEQQRKLKPLTISEDVDDTRVKLDSMLSIDKNNNVNEFLLNSKNNSVVDQLNKKVPSYSIDKLIL